MFGHVDLCLVTCQVSMSEVDLNAALLLAINEVLLLGMQLGRVFKNPLNCAIAPVDAAGLSRLVLRVGCPHSSHRS